MKRTHRAQRLIKMSNERVDKSRTASMNTNSNINDRLTSVMTVKPDIKPESLTCKKLRLLEDPNTDNPLSVSSQKTVSPPPYSPLTPLLLRNADNNFIEEPVSSPLPPMSPETQTLFDMICEDKNINDSPCAVQSNDVSKISNDEHRSDWSNIYEEIGNSDDSVKDPDYIHENEELTEDEELGEEIDEEEESDEDEDSDEDEEFDEEEGLNKDEEIDDAKEINAEINYDEELNKDVEEEVDEETDKDKELDEDEKIDEDKNIDNYELQNENKELDEGKNTNGGRVNNSKPDKKTVSSNTSVYNDNIQPTVRNYQSLLDVMMPQKVVNRRVSENLSIKQSLNRICRSSSASDSLFSLQIPAKKKTANNGDNMQLSVRNSRGPSSAIPRKLIKRRASEISTKQPSKKICRSSSASGSLFSLQIPVKKKTANNGDTMQLSIRNSQGPSSAIPRKLIKRRVSEISTKQPSKKICRSSSASGSLFSLQIPAKKKTANNGDNMQLSVRNSRGPFSAIPRKLIKRRVSEISTKQPSKKICRSSSASSSLLSLQKPETRNTSANDNTLSVRNFGALQSDVAATSSKLPKLKRISDPTQWKREREKHNRLKGESYKTIKGKLMPARPIVVPSCFRKANHTCADKVPASVRESIYTSFRSLKTLNEQREFIIRHVKKVNKKRQTTSGPSRKKYTCRYTFTVADDDIKVCRNFFLETLNITEGMVRGALSKIDHHGILTEDKRGKKTPSNKFSKEDDLFIKEHINSFPALESHYCRKNTEYKYLDANLNIATMYSLYNS